MNMLRMQNIIYLIFLNIIFSERAFLVKQVYTIELLILSAIFGFSFLDENAFILSLFYFDIQVEMLLTLNWS